MGANVRFGQARARWACFFNRAVRYSKQTFEISCWIFMLQGPKSTLDKLSEKYTKTSLKLLGIENIDYERFGDDTVTATDWPPLEKLNRSSFTSIRIKNMNENRVAFGPSFQILVFWAVWVGFWGGYFWYRLEFEPGLYLAILGILLGFLKFRPLYFDRSRGFNRGWSWDAYRVVISLSEIHAIQVIHGGFIRKSGRTGVVCRLYELNLVSTSGARVAVLTQKDRLFIESTAEVLGDFLGVAVWNTIPEQLRPRNVAPTKMAD